jgi:hypothetical protein
MDKQLIAVSASFFCGRTVDNYASTSIASTSAEVLRTGLPIKPVSSETDTKSDGNKDCETNQSLR